MKEILIALSVVAAAGGVAYLVAQQSQRNRDKVSEERRARWLELDRAQDTIEGQNIITEATFLEEARG